MGAGKKREEASYDPAKADDKLLAAGERHAALLKETQDKAIQMNSRVSEAEKKREGVAGHDLSKTEAKLQAAEERHSAIIKETQEKAAAEVARAKELAEKKAAKLQEMDDNLKAKSKEKAVMLASPAHKRSPSK